MSRGENVPTRHIKTENGSPEPFSVSEDSGTNTYSLAPGMSPQAGVIVKYMNTEQKREYMKRIRDWGVTEDGAQVSSQLFDINRKITVGGIIIIALGVIALSHFW